MKTSEKLLFASIILALLISGSFVYLIGIDPLNIAYAAVIGLVITIFPYMIHEYIAFHRIKRMELRFPDFLRSLAEGKRAGMTIPQTISNAAKSDYADLNTEIRKLNNLLTWGVPFPEAMDFFKRRTTESDHIQRGLSILMEAYYSGGDIANTMEAIARSTTELINIEKDRNSILSQQTAIMYVIQVIFVGIIIGLFGIFMPLLSAQRNTEGLGSQFLSGENLPDADYFRLLFFLTIIIQSIANGMVAGETREGKIGAGVKHSGIMMIIGLLAYMVFIYPAKYTLSINAGENLVSTGELIQIIGHFERENINIVDVNVNITLVNETVIAITNSNGDFATEIAAPDAEGEYNIEVIATHGKNRIFEIIGVTVQ